MNKLKIKTNLGVLGLKQIQKQTQFCKFKMFTRKWTISKKLQIQNIHKFNSSKVKKPFTKQLTVPEMFVNSEYFWKYEQIKMFKTLK